MLQANKNKDIIKRIAKDLFGWALNRVIVKRRGSHRVREISEVVLCCKSLV
jgi:hypothetical protein